MTAISDPGVRLTELAPGAGCGCKLSRSELRQALASMTHAMPTVEAVVVGPDTSDDAGVFDLGAGRCLVQTVDVFTPVVEDPGDWGRIAAANALSDVYAMGAQPVTALQIVCWPRRLGMHALGPVLDGAAEVLEAAGCALLGGHSIEDGSPKFGLAVTGLCEGAPLTNAAARTGDALVLTKPLGTGVVVTAQQAGAATSGQLDAAVQSMVTLNDVAATAARAVGAEAATDVTGFGLVGHLQEVCDASHLDAHVETSALPLLPGVGELVDAGHLSGGTRRNRADADASGTRLSVLPERLAWLACDAQTSGGLLVALTPRAAVELVAELRRVGHQAATIGRLEPCAGPTPVVTLR